MAYRAVIKRRGGSNRRKAMSGLSSQPPGRPISRFALGAAAVEYTPALAIPSPPPPPPPAKIAAMRRRAAMGGLSSQPPGRPVSLFALGSLGAVPDPSSLATSTFAQPTVLDPQTAAWQQQVLANQQLQLAQSDKQAEKARLQKWVQIAATASIPLFGAIWKLLFRAGER